MATLDAVKNFAKVTVSTGGYDASAVSVALSSGHGSKLPSPSTDGSFNLVWWNSSDYADPSDDPNVEVVRCTARSTDTLTIVRAQESTSASTKNTAAKTYKMILAITAKMITDIQASFTAESWVYDYVPSEAVNYSNLVFTLPNGVSASQVIVYADGVRVLGNGVQYTFSNNNTITFSVGQQPGSSVSVDYLPA